MADRKNTSRANRKGLVAGEGSGSSGGMRSQNKRVTQASELSLAEHLAVLDEATELPPFGFNIAGLEQRLERRLGFEISQVWLACLSRVYLLHSSSGSLCLRLEDFNLAQQSQHRVVSNIGESCGWTGC